MVDLYLGDCLEVMKNIQDGSINLVVVDPPYNIGKAEWDKIDNYIEWCGQWLKECDRVLKDNGSIYIFHSDMVQIAQLMEYIRQNTNFAYNSFIIWDKGDFRGLSWKNPSEKNTLRCWFNTCEYCLVYVKGDCLKTEWNRTGWEKVKFDVNNFSNLRNYFKDLHKYIGLSKKQLFNIFGQKVDHCFRYNSTQFHFIPEQTYDELTEFFNLRNWKKFREYEDLRQEYETLRAEYEQIRQEYELQRIEYESLRFVHNLDPNHNNVWYSNEKRNDGKQHPTQKPIDILERMIKCSSTEGDTVLDCFMGSGSTGVACVNTGRNFIGIEKDEKYFAIAQNRILGDIAV